MSSDGSRFVLPFQTVINAIGVPYPGAQLFFYYSGTNTPLATYQDEALTIPNPNPVPSDSGGMFGNIWLQPQAYKVVLEDANGDQIWTADPVVPAADIFNQPVAYDLPFYIEGKPGSGEIFPVYNVPRKIFLPANLTASIFTVNPAYLPTATATFTIYKNGISIGTVAFATSGSPTVTFATKITFVPGDQISIGAPNPQDTTMQNIAWTLVFTLGS